MIDDKFLGNCTHELWLFKLFEVRLFLKTISLFSKVVFNTNEEWENLHHTCQERWEHFSKCLFQHIADFWCQFALVDRESINCCSLEIWQNHYFEMAMNKKRHWDVDRITWMFEKTFVLLVPHKFHCIFSFVVFHNWLQRCNGTHNFAILLLWVYYIVENYSTVQRKLCVCEFLQKVPKILINKQKWVNILFKLKHKLNFFVDFLLSVLYNFLCTYCRETQAQCWNS